MTRRQSERWEAIAKRSISGDSSMSLCTASLGGGRTSATHLQPPAFLGRTPLCRISRGLTRMAARSCETLCASTELLLFQTPHQYRRLEKSGIPAKSLPGGKASKIFPVFWWTQRMGRCDGSGSPSTVCSRSTGPTSRVSQSHVGRCL